MNSNQRIALVLAAVALIGAGTIASLYVLSTGRTASTTTIPLPAGCTQPAGGFLIIASHLGWNDSELHGVGVTAGAVWPKMKVTQGQTVNITVCNTDVQTHSFQIEYYEDDQANTVAPQQVLHFSFVATKSGTFQVYCEVPCSIHIFMQGGQLVVAPT